MKRTPIRIDLISAFMREHGFDDRTFSEYCGIERSDFRKIREGNYSFPFETLYKIADAMRIGVIDLFWFYPVPVSYI